MAITTLGKHWYNNGKVQLFADTCPEGFKPGRLKNSVELNKKLSQIHKQKQYHWYNNGIIQIQAQECPTGFTLGRLPISDQIRKHLSESHIGKKHFISEETKQKISKTKKGKFNSNGRLGFKVSSKTKAKISKKISSVEVQEKRNKILAAHNSFNTSTPEENFYKELLNIFALADIKRQYRDARYPFNCDFYICSLDLFIELNISWTHGGHKYNINSKQDTIKLVKWKEKAKKSKYYQKAIEVWCERDPAKFKLAKTNQLNYLVAYNNKEIKKIIEYLKSITSGIV